MAAFSFPIQNMDLTYATSDIYYSQKGGLFRANYFHLLEELQMLQNSHYLDQSYLDNVVQPFLDYLLYQLKEERFNRIFSTHAEDLDPADKSIQYFLPILAEALLQRNFENRYYRSAFEDLLAFQAIVDRIFDLAIKYHTSAPMPPLVAWSQKRKGPFTITAAQIDEKIQIPIGVVCLPPEYRNGGLFAWSVMGHEVAGHNFIQNKPNFLNELTKTVKGSLEKKLTFSLERQKVSFTAEQIQYLSQYWSMSQRVEEIASDILGILSTGPSLAIGCIGYFRGMSKDGSLKRSGPFEAKKQRSIIHIEGGGVDLQIKDLSKKVEINDPQGVIGKNLAGEELRYRAYKIPSGAHPIESLRPFAMIGAIQQTDLNDPSKEGWIELIKKELNSKEFLKEKTVRIVAINTQVFPHQKTDTVIPLEIARPSAEIVGNILCTTKFQSLGGRNICQIFNWSMKDEAYVDLVRQSFKKGQLPGDVSASHIVAAAVMEASIAGADIEHLFRKMKEYLNEVRRQV